MTRRVGFGGDADGCLLTEAHVAAEAGRVPVAALGLQPWCGAAGLGEILRRRMTELMQGPH